MTNLTSTLTSASRILFFLSLLLSLLYFLPLPSRIYKRSFLNVHTWMDSVYYVNKENKISEESSNRENYMSLRVGATQKKILLLLLGGVALGLSGTPRRYFQVLHVMREEWRDIDRRALERAIASLYQSKLVGGKSNRDGTYTLILTREGRTKALAYNLEKMSIRRPKMWDQKWRVVIFDIPEHFRKRRDALRAHLQGLDFYELQKSVFVHPHECTDEIEYLIEFYQLRKFVRTLLADSIDNELHLKQHFKI